MSDHSGTTWVSFFNDTAEKLLGHPAQEMYAIKDQDPAFYDRIYDDALFKTLIVTVSMKLHIYMHIYNLSYRHVLTLTDVKCIHIHCIKCSLP